jgi:hypothetical protein
MTFTAIEMFLVALGTALGQGLAEGFERMMSQPHGPAHGFMLAISLVCWTTFRGLKGRTK